MDFENDSRERFIYYTEDAKNDIKSLEGEFERFGQVRSAIHFFLKRWAHRGKLIKEPLYLYQTQKQSNVPSFEVLYTYDERDVRIYHISVAPKEDNLLH
jgi:hypothetical protein